MVHECMKLLVRWVSSHRECMHVVFLTFIERFIDQVIFLIQQSPFNGLGRGLVTVITMVSGELDYQDAFGFSYDVVDDSAPARVNRVYPKTALFVWVLFVFLIPVLLNNMLVRTCCAYL